MKLYRHKPTEIEAERFTIPFTAPGNGIELARWCGGTYTAARKATGQPFITVQTTEGTMIALPGDWILKGVNGKFYPVKPEVFDASYETAE